jgi:hypothetical protein
VWVLLLTLQPHGILLGVQAQAPHTLQALQMVTIHLGPHFTKEILWVIAQHHQIVIVIAIEALVDILLIQQAGLQVIQPLGARVLTHL